MQLVGKAVFIASRRTFIYVKSYFHIYHKKYLTSFCFFYIIYLEYIKRLEIGRDFESICYRRNWICREECCKQINRTPPCCRAPCAVSTLPRTPGILRQQT